MNKLNITNIEFIEHIVPKGSCGTGYSEPDKFNITFENGQTKKVLIDIWYLPEKYIRGRFEKDLTNALEWDILSTDQIIKVENMYDAYKMYLEACKEYYKWDVDKILNIC